MNIGNEIGVLFLCVLFYVTVFMSAKVKLPKKKIVEPYMCPHGCDDSDNCGVCNH